MQKMEHILWRGIVTVITAAAMFLLMYRYTFAGEISGEEVYFTHSHTKGCSTVESVSCYDSHFFYYHTSDSGTFHCQTCGAQTHHVSEMDVYRCSVTEMTWQENAYNKCSICGTIKSRWGGVPGIHFYNVEKINCGLLQGERIVAVKIVADGAWTNQGVTLTAKQTVLKDDSSGSVAFSWGGGSLFVTENGTYTVNAVNGAGNSVTASIEISCIDKTAPVIRSVSGDSQGMTASGISVSVAAEDGESGLADAPYSFDGGATWTTGSSFWLEEGRLVSLRVRDKAGNISEKNIKRGDFPYPTPAPTPSPSTPAVPQVTPAPPLSDGKFDDEAKNTDMRIPVSSAEGKDGEGLSEDESMSGGARDIETSRNGENKGRKEGSGKLEGGRGEGDKLKSGKTERENGKTENRKNVFNQNGGYRDGFLFRIRLQPTLLKEEAQEGNAGGGFRVVRMDKSQTAGTADIRNPGEETAVMADYMQAVTGTWAAQNGLQDGEEAADEGGRYALTGGLPLQEGKKAGGFAQRVLKWIKERAGLTAGILLSGLGILWSGRLLWLYSAELYCYDNGNEYRRLGLLHIRKRKRELELYLPDYVLTKTGAPRYRLVVKNRLVKRFGKMDLVVYSDEYRLRRPLEECVDFVL